MAEGRWHEGDVIRKLRTLVGWTLEDLSKASGVNISVIHDLEVGTTKNPQRETLERLSKPFGMSARELRNLVPTERLTFDAAVAIKKLGTGTERAPSSVKKKSGVA